MNSFLVIICVFQPFFSSKKRFSVALLQSLKSVTLPPSFFGFSYLSSCHLWNALCPLSVSEDSLEAATLCIGVLQLRKFGISICKM